MLQVLLCLPSLKQKMFLHSHPSHIITTVLSVLDCTTSTIIPEAPWRYFRAYGVDMHADRVSSSLFLHLPPLISLFPVSPMSSSSLSIHPSINPSIYLSLLSGHQLLSKSCHIISCHIDPPQANTPVTIEVDLREESERTVHWFVDEIQQKPFIVDVPEAVLFAVCLLVIINFLFIILFICLFLSSFHH